MYDLMTDMFGLVGRWFDGLADYPACREYIQRATGRPAFVKAHADQIAFYTESDKNIS